MAGRHDQLGVELCRHVSGAIDDRGSHGLQAFGAELAGQQRHVVLKQLFGGQSDAVHHLDRFARVLADGRFAREHAGVAAVENGVGHVGGLGPRRPPRVLHAVEHLRGDDHRLLMFAAGGHDLLLHHGHPGHVDLHAQVAAGHHDAVGRDDDLFQAVERLLLFDLGDDTRRHGAITQQDFQFAARRPDRARS